MSQIQLYIVVNSKGGVGKSTTAVQILSMLDDVENVQYLELDSANSTRDEFQESRYFETMKSSKAGDAEKILDDYFFNLRMNPEKKLIIDIGGGLDANIVIEQLLEQPLLIEKTRIFIPVSQTTSEKNIVETFNLIDDEDLKKQVKLILNLAKSEDKKELEDEFFNFFGDEGLGLAGVAKKLDLEYTILNYSKFFAISQKLSMSLRELAEICMEYKNNREAADHIIELANGDKEKYNNMYRRYRISLSAKKDFEKIIKNFDIN